MSNLVKLKIFSVDFLNDLRKKTKIFFNKKKVVILFNFVRKVLELKQRLVKMRIQFNSRNLIFLLLSRQQICLDVLYFETIKDLKVELKEILNLTSLTTNKLFNNYKVLENLVIDKNLNEKILYYKKQLESLFFKVTNNDKYLLVINDVILLYKSQTNEKVRYELQLIVFVQL